MQDKSLTIHNLMNLLPNYAKIPGVILVVVFPKTLHQGWNKPSLRKLCPERTAENQEVENLAFLTGLYEKGGQKRLKVKDTRYLINVLFV